MWAEDVVITGAGTGAASKDNSQLEIRNSRIEGIKTTALMAYIKKPEYGGGSILAENLTIIPPAAAARVQNGNSITIDDEWVKSENLDVKEMYNTIMKPGMRR